MRTSWLNGGDLTEMSFKYLFLFRNNFKGFSFDLIDMSISNNQKSCKIRNISRPILVLCYTKLLGKQTLALWDTFLNYD